LQWGYEVTKKNTTLGGRMIQDVKEIVAKFGEAGKPVSRVASERIVPVPQVDTYSELPFAPVVETVDISSSRRSARPAKTKSKLKDGSSKPSKPRGRTTRKPRKKRAKVK
jgi:hypothetical protein